MYLSALTTLAGRKGLTKKQVARLCRHNKRLSVLHNHWIYCTDRYGLTHEECQEILDMGIELLNCIGERMVEEERKRKEHTDTLLGDIKGA